MYGYMFISELPSTPGTPSEQSKCKYPKDVPENYEYCTNINGRYSGGQKGNKGLSPTAAHSNGEAK
jgi:hypothetical protein